jgi:protein TonB
VPPTPPAPPAPTTVIEQPVTILSQVPRPAPEPVVEEPAPPELAPAAQSTEPAFTPMTVRPVLTNGAEVQQALMREYPAVLRDAGIGGAPVLWIHIATDGSVDDTRIHETSGQSALDEAAQRVAAAMRFQPAQNSDDVVAVWVQIPIRFAVVN